MAKMKPGQISAKRAYEISDSLMNRSKGLKESAYDQIDIGKGAIKNGVGDKQVRINTSDLSAPYSLSGRDRLNIGQQRLREASADSAKSVRLKSAADAAMAKANATAGRDMPLPSSDGILGTITNKLSEMFKK